MESRPASSVDAVRLIAVDMDGTFLDANSSYDRERFARLHGHVAERGVQFVVARACLVTLFGVSPAG